MTDFEKYIKGRIAKILHDLDNQITLYDNSLADVQRHKENATNAIFDIMSLSKLEEVYIAGMNEGKEQLVKMANDVFKNLPQLPINANEKCNLHIVSNSEAEYCECEKPTLGKSVSRCGNCDKWFEPI